MTEKQTQNKLLDFILFMNAKYQGFLLFTLLTVIVLIVFEAFQQYYFIIQFDLVPPTNVHLSELAVSQTYRWLIWLITTLVYFGTVIYKGHSDQLFKIANPWTALFHLALLIAVNVAIISLLQLAMTDRLINIENWLDNCIFFIFQKTPIYTLAYIAILGLFHMVNSNQNLAIEILDLKNQNAPSQSESLQALSIKIGSRNKIIPLADIIWIEAYDYCVKIHTVSQHSYAMRNSLKALEKRLLDQHFLRVHRKAIVNMSKVSEVTYNSSSFLTLEDQTRVDIAQSRVRDIKSFFQPPS